MKLVKGALRRPTLPPQVAGPALGALNVASMATAAPPGESVRDHAAYDVRRRRVFGICGL